MSNEENTLVVGRSVEEDQGNSSVVQDVFAAENCSAQCPTCQQSCGYPAGHAGLHHCQKGHEWIYSLSKSDEQVLLPTSERKPGAWELDAPRRECVVFCRF